MSDANQRCISKPNTGTNRFFCEERMNRFWRSVANYSVALGAAFLFLLPLTAQQTLGSINGTVLDPSGAAITGATVTVTASAIGVTRTTTTQGTGFYQIFNLPVGTYTVKVGHEGFDTTRLTASRCRRRGHHGQCHAEGRARVGIG